MPGVTGTEQPCWGLFSGQDSSGCEEDQQGGSNDFHFPLPMLYKCLDFCHKPGCSLMPCFGGISVLKYKMQNPRHITPLGDPVSTPCQCNHSAPVQCHSWGNEAAASSQSSRETECPRTNRPCVHSLLQVGEKATRRTGWLAAEPRYSPSRGPQNRLHLPTKRKRPQPVVKHPFCLEKTVTVEFSEM